MLPLAITTGLFVIFFEVDILFPLNCLVFHQFLSGVAHVSNGPPPTIKAPVAQKAEAAPITEPPKPKSRGKIAWLAFISMVRIPMASPTRPSGVT